MEDLGDQSGLLYGKCQPFFDSGGSLARKGVGRGGMVGGVNHVNVSKALLTFSRLRAQMIISIYRHIEMTTHAIHREVFLEDYYCGP